MKSSEYLRVLQWDMHKVKVIMSYTGLFNEYVKWFFFFFPLCPNPTPCICNEWFKAPFALKNIHWFDGRLVIEGQGKQTVREVLKWRLQA